MTYRVLTRPPNTQRAAFRQSLVVFAPWLCLIVGCGGAAGSAGGSPPSSSPSAERLPIPLQLPEFALTERSGETVTLSHLKGRVWVADFIFTRCPGPCPRMSRRFADLQKAFGRLDDVRLVSISVDPEHDTPEVLAEYAQTYDADPQRWLFLTGSQQAIIELAVKGFKIAADQENPNLHGLHFALVGRRGRVHGYYRSADDQAMARLRRHVRQLAQEPAE